MIINIRGWNGAGKSTLVNALLVDAGAHELETFPHPPTGRGRSFSAYGEPVAGLFAVGRYLRPNMIGDGDMVDEDFGRGVVRLYSQFGGVVLLESLKLNRERTPDSAWNRFFLEENSLIAMLDTPFEECITRVYSRREASGRNLGRPLKLLDQRSQYDLMWKYFDRMRDAGARTAILSHEGTEAFRQMKALIGMEQET